MCCNLNEWHSKPTQNPFIASHARVKKMAETRNSLLYEKLQENVARLTAPYITSRWLRIVTIDSITNRSFARILKPGKSCRLRGHLLDDGCNRKERELGSASSTIRPFLRIPRSVVWFHLFHSVLCLHRSDRIFRAFYVPFLSERHTTYINYNLLRRLHRNRKKKSKADRQYQEETEDAQWQFVEFYF